MSETFSLYLNVSTLEQDHRRSILGATLSGDADAVVKLKCCKQLQSASLQEYKVMMIRNRTRENNLYLQSWIKSEEGQKLPSKCLNNITYSESPTSFLSYWTFQIYFLYFCFFCTKAQWHRMNNNMRWVYSVCISIFVPHNSLIWKNSVK